MYLKDNREIYECEQFPGYYIDANTGNFCDEEGNYIGGNIDDGDTPGNKNAVMLDVPDIVFVSKTGKLYYPKPNKTASLPMDLDKAHQKGLKPSLSYCKFVEKIYRNHIKKLSKSRKK